MKNRGSKISIIEKTLLLGSILFPLFIFIIFIITNIWLIQDFYWASPIIYLMVSVILVRKYVDILDLELYAGVSSKLLFLPVLLVSDIYPKNTYPQVILIMGPGYGFTTPIEAYIFFIITVTIPYKYEIISERNLLWRWTPYIASLLILIFYMYMIFHGSKSMKRRIAKVFYGVSTLYNIALILSSLYGLAPMLLVINIVYLITNTYRLLTI